MEKWKYYERRADWVVTPYAYLCPACYNSAMRISQEEDMDMRIFSIFVILLTLLTGLSLTQPPAHAQTDLGSCVELINAIRADVDSTAPLPERYQDLRLIDIHNHDSANVDRVMSDWNALYVDQTVIFGAISEPRAIRSDQRGLRAYSHYPDRVFPFFAGVDTYGEDGVEQVRANLEQGYYGIGEIVGASSYSPMTSNLAWKAEHPHDGNLPAIYDLAADYGVPVLLHIDPPDGYPIQKLEEALDAHPDTILIFAHANAYNSPSNIDRLLAVHPNLSIDFFAGFTAYNQDSTNTLADFIPMKLSMAGLGVVPAGCLVWQSAKQRRRAGKLIA